MRVCGKNVIKELIRSNNKLVKVYITNKFEDNEIIDYINLNKINYEISDKTKLDKLTKGNHQGIVAEIEDYKTCKLEQIINSSNNKLIVMLDHLEDPHNFGAIIRTCEAAGVGGIIIPKDRSVSVNETVMKTSAGALSYTKISTVTNLVNTINYLKKEGYFIVGTDASGVDYNEIDYNMKVCLVIGSEGFGMSRLVQSACDFVVKLPMNGHVNSLNASVATGVMIYKIIG